MLRPQLRKFRFACKPFGGQTIKYISQFATLFPHYGLRTILSLIDFSPAIELLWVSSVGISYELVRFSVGVRWRLVSGKKHPNHCSRSNFHSTSVCCRRAKHTKRLLDDLLHTGIPCGLETFQELNLVACAKFFMSYMCCVPNVDNHIALQPHHHHISDVYVRICAL